MRTLAGFTVMAIGLALAIGGMLLAAMVGTTSAGHGTGMVLYIAALLVGVVGVGRGIKMVG